MNVTFPFKDDPEGHAFLRRMFVETLEVLVAIYPEYFTAQRMPLYYHFLERLAYYQDLWSKG